MSGFSFAANDASINVDEDEIRVLQPVLGNEDHLEFRPLQTVASAFFQLLITIVFGTTALTLGFVWPAQRERCEPFYFLLYMQAIFWVFTMALHFFIRSRHHHLRISGFLDFYMDMSLLYRLPAYITCLCSVLLLVIATIIQQVYRELENQCQPRTRIFTPVTYVGVIIFVQTLSIVPCLISYIRRVRRFNRVQPPPDVEREEWLASLIEETYRRPEIGFRERRDQNEELLERQADYIRHLREHNVVLGSKLVQLTARLTGNTD